jgi:hypothetical protein
VGRLPKVRSDYEALAEQRDLVFMGSTTPESIKISTVWKCKRCGRVIRKSYDNTRQHENGCICWSKSLTLDDYQELGNKLEIDWSALEFVPNISTKTMWKSRKLGVYFNASYRELAYDRIPKRLRIYVKQRKQPKSA